jgi:hypothetical protein
MHPDLSAVRARWMQQRPQIPYKTRMACVCCGEGYMCPCLCTWYSRYWLYNRRIEERPRGWALDFTCQYVTLEMTSGVCYGQRSRALFGKRRYLYER